MINLPFIASLIALYIDPGYLYFQSLKNLIKIQNFELFKNFNRTIPIHP